MNNITALAQRMKAAAEREIIFRDTDETSNTWQYNVTPENVLALVEALEKALAGERRWHRVASRVHEQACDSDVKIDELEKSHAQVIQSRDHYKRMTEEGLKQLAESRTVTLPKRYSCEGYHIDEAYLQEDPKGDCYDRDEVLEALAAAGIQVIEGEA